MALSESTLKLWRDYCESRQWQEDRDRTWTVADDECEILRPQARDRRAQGLPVIERDGHFFYRPDRRLTERYRDQRATYTTQDAIDLFESNGVNEPVVLLRRGDGTWPEDNDELARLPRGRWKPEGELEAQRIVEWIDVCSPDELDKRQRRGWIAVKTYEPGE